MYKTLLHVSGILYLFHLDILNILHHYCMLISSNVFFLSITLYVLNKFIEHFLIISPFTLVIEFAMFSSDFTLFF